MAAYTRRYDSSSSDEDYRQSRCDDLKELHYNKDCRYNKFKLRLEGRDVYVWLRSCFCDRYRTYNIKKGVKNLQPENGKDVHLGNECRWRKTEKKDCWELRRKCTKACGSPRGQSYVGNTTFTYR